METSVRTPRPEKVAVVDEVRSRFGETDAAILTEYRGLSVKDMEALRRLLTEVGGDYKVYKNTLVSRAAHEIGLEALDELLVGPTAIAFVEGDVAQVAKVLRDFARTNPNLVVKGGLLGQNLLDARRAAALADLPSREALLAQIAGVLAAPMQRFAGLLQAVPQRVAYALSALLEERQRSEPAAAAPAAAEPAATDTAEAEDAPAEAATDTVAEAAPAPEAEESAPEVAAAAEAESSEAPAAEAPAEEAATAEVEEDASGDAEAASEPAGD